MNTAVVVDAVRSPMGRGKAGGALAGLHAVELLAQVLAGLVRRNDLDPASVEDVIIGCVSQGGEQAATPGRQAWLAAGFPEQVPATTIDRRCGSSQQALHFAAQGVIAGAYDIVIAGGVESMSRVPIGSSSLGKDKFGLSFGERYGEERPHQGIGAELIAERWGLSRTRLDEFSLASHEKAAAARAEGRFAAQIAPVTLPDGTVLAEDEGIRTGGTLESLGALTTVFKEDGVIHAGNSSQIADGSAALLMTTSERAAELGLTPIARVHTAVLAGSDPFLMLTGPIPATAKLLDRAGVRLDEIGAFEVNEAFASVPLAWLADVGADPKLCNPLGGAIALGHPLGGSGARLATTLLHHMRDNGIRYGLQTMCEGGGQANATLFELF